MIKYSRRNKKKDHQGMSSHKTEDTNKSQNTSFCTKKMNKTKNKPVKTNSHFYNTTKISTKT